MVNSSVISVSLVLRVILAERFFDFLGLILFPLLAG